MARSMPGQYVEHDMLVRCLGVLRSGMFSGYEYDLSDLVKYFHVRPVRFHWNAQQCYDLEFIKEIEQQPVPIKDIAYALPSLLWDMSRDIDAFFYEMDPFLGDGNVWEEERIQFQKEFDKFYGQASNLDKT
jgi:hypothetical protein